MLISAKDDPICLHKDLPHVDVLSNQNGMLIESDFGAHCDFFTKEKIDGITHYRRFFPDIIVKYLDEVSSFNQIQDLKKQNKQR